MYQIREKWYQFFFDLPVLTMDCHRYAYFVHSGDRICSHLERETGTMSTYRTASGRRGFLGSGFSDRFMPVIRIRGFPDIRGRVRSIGWVNEKSDTGFLVELEPGRTLFDLGGFAYDLEKLLGRPVDVCTVPILREPVCSRVVAEAIPL